MFSIDELERAAEIVHNVLPETPQIRWPLLCQRLEADVWVKQENHTPIGAFKIRGALFYIAELRRKHPEVEGVIAATRGNFGQSVTFAGVRAGLRTVIVVPWLTPSVSTLRMLLASRTVPSFTTSTRVSLKRAAVCTNSAAGLAWSPTLFMMVKRRSVMTLSSSVVSQILVRVAGFPHVVCQGRGISRVCSLRPRTHSVKVAYVSPTRSGRWPVKSKP